MLNKCGMAFDPLLPHPHEETQRARCVAILRNTARSEHRHSECGIKGSCAISHSSNLSVNCGRCWNVIFVVTCHISSDITDMTIRSMCWVSDRLLSTTNVASKRNAFDSGQSFPFVRVVLKPWTGSCPRSHHTTLHIDLIVMSSNVTLNAVSYTHLTLPTKRIV